MSWNSWEISVPLALAEGVVKAGDTEGMTNTVKVKDDSLADCKRILEGQVAFPVQAGETEPVDLVVVEDASGSFSDNFPHVRQAIDEVVQGLSDQDRVMRLRIVAENNLYFLMEK